MAILGFGNSEPVALMAYWDKGVNGADPDSGHQEVNFMNNGQRQSSFGRGLKTVDGFTYEKPSVIVKFSGEFGRKLKEKAITKGSNIDDPGYCAKHSQNFLFAAADSLGVGQKVRNLFPREARASINMHEVLKNENEIESLFNGQVEVVSNQQEIQNLQPTANNSGNIASSSIGSQSSTGGTTTPTNSFQQPDINNNLNQEGFNQPSVYQRA
ncbi:MAG: hypothetical protein QNJ31_02310 [Candidatus Caenarcaniphilales bacterium]|nr:hypothetical protein [Candidatus Caenarcaniphilales bacterium]